jgi:hypothetical protein
MVVSVEGEERDGPASTAIGRLSSDRKAIVEFIHRHLIDLQMAIKDWLGTASDPWSSFQDIDSYDLI